MESNRSSLSPPTTKRLLFDRRYGWIFDDWKNPSQEALHGGRGMFCVVPLARNLVHLASQSMNLAGSSAVKVLENPELISPQVLGAKINEQLQRLQFSMQNRK
ncbi:uncharacterized protein LOC124936538 [Impatiens glandulifera]|uniref:uncharacterized protein LOC124936538 n=1 Tax=Impatiens glandulifera TaxID=253017 RepID=UPI001FB155EC|nr:uncharacterized protein LOC124936538 [Impatiens glandulifera]